MSNKIQIKRGIRDKLPILDAGEPAFTTDTKQFFVGDGSENIEFAKQEDLENTNTKVKDLENQKANDTDDTRTTTSKTVTGAINELNSTKANKDGTLQTNLNSEKVGGKLAVNISNSKRLKAGDFQNTKLESGFYTNTGDGILDQNGNLFRGEWWHIQVSYHFDNNGYGMQIATPLNNDNESRYYRTSGGTTWNTWRKILDQRDYDKLFQYANNGKQYWVDVVGSSLAITDTFSTLKDKTQAIKNTIAANISSKGVAVSNADTLNNLADAISKITTKTLDGRKVFTGPVISSSNMLSFIKENSNTKNCYYVDIKGFDFAIDRIIIQAGTYELTAYNVGCLTMTEGNSSVLNIRTDIGGVILQNNHVRLPVQSANTSYNFIIIGL